MFELYLQQLLDSEILKEQNLSAVTLPNCSFIQLDDQLRARVEFTSGLVHNQYSKICVKIINRTQGLVDQMVFDLCDVIGVQTVRNQNIHPHLYKDGQKINWYIYVPNHYDMERCCRTIMTYISQFRQTKTKRG